MNVGEPPALTWARTESALTPNPPFNPINGTTYSWTASANASASGGEFHYVSGDTTAAFEFSFTGRGIRLIAVTATGGGIGRVLVDGVDPVLVDFYSASVLWQQTVFEKIGLTNGSHVLRIESTNTQSPGAASYNVYIDAFDVGT